MTAHTHDPQAEADDYRDVREYDSTFDIVATALTPDELAQHAAHIRGSIGYVAWKHGVPPSEFYAVMMRELDRLMAEVYPDE